MHEEIQLTFETKTTPFACRETDQIVYDRAERKGGLKAKITKGFLKEPELLVIQSLTKYTFLNANMLSIILERDIGYPKASMKQLLSRMTKGRYITRFRVSYKDSFDKEHRSSYIYTLADNIFNNGNIELLSRTAYSYLAFNQFNLAVTQRYHSIMSGFYFKGEGAIDGAVSFTSEGKNVSMNIITARKGAAAQTWTQDILQKYAEEEHNIGTLLILCESELHALEIDQVVKSIDGLNDTRVFYMCDYATAGQNTPFDNVIRIKGNNEYEIVTIPVDDISSRVNAGLQNE